jgi:hypothetical protein
MFSMGWDVGMKSKSSRAKDKKAAWRKFLEDLDSDSSNETLCHVGESERPEVAIAAEPAEIATSRALFAPELP